MILYCKYCKHPREFEEFTLEKFKEAEETIRLKCSKDAKIEPISGLVCSGLHTCENCNQSWEYKIKLDDCESESINKTERLKI